jgi:DNA-binding beta-propeller fold protein YncE
LATIDVRLPHEGTFEGPTAVAVGLGGVWVSQPVQGVVTRIDPRTDKVIAHIHIPPSPGWGTLAVGAGSIWAGWAKQIFRIDPKTNRIIASARIGKHVGTDYRGLRRIMVDGNTLWVTDGDADTVDRITLDP